MQVQPLWDQTLVTNESQKLAIDGGLGCSIVVARETTRFGDPERLSRTKNSCIIRRKKCACVYIGIIILKYFKEDT